jgi:hypothetical protein
MNQWERFSQGMGLFINSVPTNLDEVVSAIAVLPSLDPITSEELQKRQDSPRVTPQQAIEIIDLEATLEPNPNPDGTPISEAVREFLLFILDKAIKEDGGLVGLVLISPNDGGETSYVEFGFPDDIEPPAELR